MNGDKVFGGVTGTMSFKKFYSDVKGNLLSATQNMHINFKHNKFHGWVFTITAKRDNESK